MKKLIVLLTVLLLIACAAHAEDWNSRAALYEPVLDEWAAGLAAAPDAILTGESIEEARHVVWYTTGRDPLEVIGYTYLDMDGDGSPELAIGAVDGEQALGTDIFEILTIADGKPVTVLRGWERFRVSLTYDYQTGQYGYYAEGSSGASNTVYEYSQGGWKNAQVLESNYDFDSNKQVWTLDGAEIPESQAEALISAWQGKRHDLGPIPFMEREEGRERLGFLDAQTPGVEGAFCRSFRVTEDGPTLDVIISDTGKRNSMEARHENVLSVTITVRDLNQVQSFEYDSAENPVNDSLGALARLEDMNFDGYRDLVLCAARGAANEYSVFCLWDPEAGQFGDIITQDAFDLDTERASGRVTPLELVNYSLQRSHAGFGYIVSREQDGAACYTRLVYGWEGNGRTPTLIHVHDLSYAAGSLVRDRAFIFFSQGEKVWDHVYPSEWYYGATEPFRAFEAAADSLWQGGGTVSKHVDNVDWVNVREWDSKQSLSQAHLDQGTEVQVLKENCADGWTLVLWDTGEPQEEWFGSRTEIGYIWHSYLK